MVKAHDSGSLDTPDERRLAGTLAGVLFFAAAAGMPLLPLLPGGGTNHWGVLLAVVAICAVWASLCLWVIPFETVPRFVYVVPGLAGLGLIAIVMASTGGASSPARFYSFFVLVYGTYFLAPREAYAFMAGCLVAHATPLLYDSGGQYVGEVVVMSSVYVLLGLLLLRAKALLVKLRKQADELARHDPLTALPNRRAMLAWLHRALDPDEDLGPVGLVLVDLDGFKDVNTVHGYPEGDRVLCETARVLEGCVRGEDMVARLGGDEFALLAVRATEDGMKMLAERILLATRGLQDTLGLEDVRLTASVGWVLYPNDADSIEELIATADVCMRAAKANGKDRALSAIDWLAEPKDPAQSLPAVRG